jgi:CheY-like chemotaxis protein
MLLPILLVDDNPDACATAAKLLWANGYHADMAHDGPSALQQIEAQPYALAIIDYHLPGTNGVELFRQMRQLRPRLTGIFLTGFPLLIDPAEDAGIVEVLPKPVDFDKLLRLLEENVGPPVRRVESAYDSRD